MGAVKVGSIQAMAADTVARRTADAMVCRSTMWVYTISTGSRVTGMQRTVGAAGQYRIGMTRLAVAVVNIRNDMRTVMTAGTLA